MKQFLSFFLLLSISVPVVNAQDDQMRPEVENLIVAMAEIPENIAVAMENMLNAEDRSTAVISLITMNMQGYALCSYMYLLAREGYLISNRKTKRKVHTCLEGTQENHEYLREILPMNLRLMIPKELDQEW